MSGLTTRRLRTASLAPVLLAVAVALLPVLWGRGDSLRAYGQAPPRKNSLQCSISSCALPSTPCTGPTVPLGGRPTEKMELLPMGKASGAVRKVESEEEIAAFVGTGSDIVMKLSFSWCGQCRIFMPMYEKLAKIYPRTLFLTLVGNENESCKRYARETLHVEFAPMFALYSGGQLVETWSGGDPERFVKNVEGRLPSAKGCMREAVIAAGFASEAQSCPGLRGKRDVRLVRKFGADSIPVISGGVTTDL